MQAVVEKEIDSMLAMGVIERSEAARITTSVSKERRWHIQGVHKF